MAPTLLVLPSILHPTCSRRARARVRGTGGVVRGERLSDAYDGVQSEGGRSKPGSDPFTRKANRERPGFVGIFQNTVKCGL